MISYRWVRVQKTLPIRLLRQIRKTHVSYRSGIKDAIPDAAAVYLPIKGQKSEANFNTMFPGISSSFLFVVLG